MLKTTQYPYPVFQRIILFAFLCMALFLSYTADTAGKQNPVLPAPAPCVSDYGGHCADLAAMASRGELAQVGLEFLKIPEGATFGQVLSRLYVFGIGLVGISALIMVVFGGVKYMTAAGSPQRIGDAKSTITNALFGVALALISWILLYTINPDLVRVLDLETRLEQTLPATGSGPGLVTIWRCSANGTTYATLPSCTASCSGGTCSQ